MVSFRSHLAALITLIAVGTAGAQEADAALDRWLASQADIGTWSAKLTQTRRLKTLKQPLVSTGRVWFMAPRRFRWELGEPAQTIAIRAEAELIVAYPRLERAEVYPLDAEGPWKSALDLFEAGFPRDRKELEARFKLEGAERAGDRMLLRLRPRDPTARRLVAALQIETNPDTGALLATEIVFADGSTLRNDFHDPVINPALQSAVFEFSIPPNFAVTRAGGRR